MKKISFLALATVLCLCSCDKDEDPVICDTSSTDYSKGAYVVNEGAFQGNNASITFYDKSASAYESVFSTVNGNDLGDVAQSMAIGSDQGYIVVNYSFKIEVVNLATFERVATIVDPSIDYPRFMVEADENNMYLSNGSFSGSVIIIDKDDHTVSGSIPVGGGPEKMVKLGEQVIVANSGGWGLDSTISVIDIATEMLVNTIELSHRPIDMEIDNNMGLWVLCSGTTLFDADWNVIGNSMAQIHEVDVESGNVIHTVDIGVEGDHPSSIAFDVASGFIWLVNNGLHTLDTNDPNAGWTEVSTAAYNSIDYNPSTGDMWATEVADFTSTNSVSILDANGTVVSTFQAGIAPRQVVFRD
jgi:hypothetical protein